MPKVSVIMGVYNSNREWLRKSIDSICKQTFSDFEFVICNDASSNETYQWVKERAEQDSRIKLVSNSENQGLAASLNHCLEIAAGELIARQDDDDISELLRLEQQVQFLDQNPEYALVGTNASVIDAQGTVWGQYQCEEIPQKNTFLWSNPFAHPTIVMRADVLRKLNGDRVARETRRCEDYDLFMRLYATGYRGYNLQEDLYQYRILNEKKRYRPMKDRIDEAIVRGKGYRALGLLPQGIPYAVKPLLVGMIPTKLYQKITSKKYQLADKS